MSTFTTAREHTLDLGAFVEASPTSYHAVQTTAQRLRGCGFVEQLEAEPFVGEPGQWFLIRDGGLIAWRIPEGNLLERGFRIVGSHTDSPTFKLKPRPDYQTVGWQQLGVEVYGGMLPNSWLDRELGLAGRLVTSSGEVRLVQTGPIMRIPQLAIHLDRNVATDGLKLDRQRHLAPIWSIGEQSFSVIEMLADIAGIDSPNDIYGHDIVTYDTQSPRTFGANSEFLASGRLDNLLSVHASLMALLDITAAHDIQVLAAFDHEEIGSGSSTGAAGPLLETFLRRLVNALGGTEDQFGQMLARSTCISADAAHSIHPNYAERHDPQNHPLVNAGPALKVNACQRYATDAIGEAIWHRACRLAHVPHQVFVGNNSMPCGSTIGPITATRLGIRTIDVGAPILSMHSAREMCGIDDPYWLTKALGSYWSAEN